MEALESPVVALGMNFAQDIATHGGWSSDNREWNNG